MAIDHWKKRKPAFGDHIRVKRTVPHPPFIYYHHGIYVSDDEVINFNGEPGSKIENKKIKEQMIEAKIVVSTMAQFLSGDPFDVNTSKAKFPPEQVVQNARQAIGTRQGTYNLVSNNCEHFCNECRNGKPESKQVQKIIAGVSVALGAAGALIINAAVSDNKAKQNSHCQKEKKSTKEDSEA